MDLKKIAIAAGSAALNKVVPGSGLVLGTILNQFLPKDKQVDPEEITGDQAIEVYNELPPEVQSKVLEKTLEVEIEAGKDYVEIQKILNDADRSGASTRPQIALMMAWVVVGFSIMYSIGVIIKVWKTQQLPAWEELAIALGIPSIVLREFFGARSGDKLVRAQLASSQLAMPGSNPVIGKGGSSLLSTVADRMLSKK